ncbi:hypothetical protein WJX75_007364 [Coccomyxa subellipsoidea]|uniref:WW domain-containing protein n=1 Tax=Coccomyxa subellipsoidea TaxID=248742 RepID=A0ABR2YGQ5_9CHLO
MELHHKLRRDPSWHPSGCNICGQLGHQAANCTNGTINWRQIYGDEAFRLKEPIYPSDIYRMTKEKEVDFTDLEKRAQEWAKTHANGAAPVAAMPAVVKVAADSAAAAAVPAAAGGAAAAAPAPVEAPLPEGWGAAKDAQGRTYFWHKSTKKVQWDRPNADTPIS